MTLCRSTPARMLSNSAELTLVLYEVNANLKILKLMLSNIPDRIPWMVVTLVRIYLYFVVQLSNIAWRLSPVVISVTTAEDGQPLEHRRFISNQSSNGKIALDSQNILLPINVYCVSTAVNDILKGVHTSVSACTTSNDHLDSTKTRDIFKPRKE